MSKQTEALESANTLIELLLVHTENLSDYAKERLAKDLATRGIDLKEEKSARIEAIKEGYKNA